MIISINNNSQKGPGYATISLRARDWQPLPEPGEDFSFIISSPSRGECLGENGWVQSETKLHPDTFSYAGGEITLEVGPAVVDNLEPLENYRFCITFPNEERCGALVCRNIIQSPLQTGRTGFGKAEQINKAPMPPPAPPAPPPPPPEPEPTQPTPIVDAATESFLHMKSPQAQSYDQLSAPDPFFEQQKGPGKTILIIVLIIVLLGALGIGACYFSKHKNSETPLANATDSVEQPDTGDGDTGQPKDSALPSTDPSGASLGPLQMARGVLRNNPSDEELHKTLAMIPLDQDNADAYFLIIEELAERGDAESLYILGTFYDPVINAPHGSIEKDPEQAYKCYIQAKNGGWQSAATTLGELKIWLQQEAQNGSSQAQSLLDRWE